MRLRWLLIGLLVGVVSPLFAQSSVLSIGVRGGGQFWLCAPTDTKTTTLGNGAGGNGVLDLRYSLYGLMADDRVGFGFLLGAGIGYGGTAIKGTQTGAFTNTDYLGNKLNYTTNLTFSRAERYATGEVSLMLAFGAGGFTLNIGPRFMAPFGVSTTQTITDATIDAYLDPYDVHIVNEAITGKLATPYAVDTFPSVVPPYHLLLAIEAGWEFAVSRSNNGRLGVQLYTNIGLWSQATSTQAKTSLLTVGAIEAEDRDPEVKVHDSAGLIAGRKYLDFGVRLYYAFPVGAKKKMRQTGSSDANQHKNRYLW